MNLTDHRRDDLIMAATAHYLGRSTIAVGDHTKWLWEVWDQLEPHVQQFIERIVEDAIRREQTLFDSRGIAYTSSLGLGGKCDRECWLLLRDKWYRNRDSK